MADHDGPRRTCIGCRVRAGSRELVRYALERTADGNVRVVRDDAGRLHGRGAWLHDDDDCRQLAIRRRALRRAFRIAGDAGLGFPEHGRADGNDGDGHVTSPTEDRRADGIRG